MEHRLRVKKIVQEKLSLKRFSHSVRTAELAVSLCSIYEGNSKKAEIAGLCHDYARELPLEELTGIAARGYSVADWEREHPILLHGKAGAVLIQEEIGIRDSSILEAVRTHVTGEPDMSLLSKIIFIADYLEPGRRHIDGTLSGNIGIYTIDELLFEVLKNIFNYLENNDKFIAGPAIDLYKQLEKKVRYKKKKKRI